MFAPVPLQDLLVLLFVAAVAACDSTTHRIPNWLTIPAATVGFATSVASAGVSGAVTSVLGLLVGLGLFMPFFLARGFGAGDVKAMAAVGALLGPQGACAAAACTLVAGAIGGLALLARRGGRPALRALAYRLLPVPGIGPAICRALPPEPTASTAGGMRFPYGLAIAGGTIVSLAWR